VLLGVGLALLLAGGGALAQGLTVAADQDCVECWPGPYDEAMPDEYLVSIVITGWDYDQPLCRRIHFNGHLLQDYGCQIESAGSDPIRSAFAMPCEMPEYNLQGLAAEIVTPAQYDVEDYYGEWEYCARQPDGAIAGVTWLFAEVCEEEFVPEAGTIALLGSGLAGLAGYVTLRLRSRA
jgi:hypothetical protein